MHVPLHCASTTAFLFNLFRIPQEVYIIHTVGGADIYFLSFFVFG